LPRAEGCRNPGSALADPLPTKTWGLQETPTNLRRGQPECQSRFPRARARVCR
jgi:hypothetical protein